MKKNWIFITTLIMIVGFTCCTRENSLRILIIVEKGTSSVGFYSTEGEHMKSIKLDTFPHEMRFSPDRKFAYITNNGSLRFTDSARGGETISVINLHTLDKEQDISLFPFKRPHGIDIDPVTGFLAVGVENPDKVLLIDPDRKKIFKTFDCQGKTPHMVTISKGAEWIYVSNVQSANLTAINTKSGEYFTIKVGFKPQESVLNKNGTILFVGCDEYISVIDLSERRETAQIPIGANRLELLGEGDLLVFSSTKNGIGFADPITYEVLHHIDIPYKPYSIHLSEDEKTAFVSAEEEDIVYVVSVGAKKIRAQFKLKAGTRPDPVMDISSKTGI